jgi:hypothetical protein
MNKIENKTGAKSIIIHDRKNIIDEIDIPEGSTVITGGYVIEGNEKERKDKIKELKLNEKVKDKKA